MPDVRGGETPALLRQAPALTLSDAAEIARALYGVVAEASSLPSERDQNFLLRTADGIPLRSEDCQRSGTLRRCSTPRTQPSRTWAAEPTCVPQCAPALDGRMLSTIASPLSPEPHFVRLLTWLPGVTLGSVTRRSPSLAEERRAGDRATGRGARRVRSSGDSPRLLLGSGRRAARRTRECQADRRRRSYARPSSGCTDRIEQQDHANGSGIATVRGPQRPERLQRPGRAARSHEDGRLRACDRRRGFRRSRAQLFELAILPSRSPTPFSAAVTPLAMQRSSCAATTRIRPLSDLEIDTLFPLILLQAVRQRRHCCLADGRPSGRSIPGRQPGADQEHASAPGGDPPDAGRHDIPDRVRTSCNGGDSPCPRVARAASCRTCANSRLRHLEVDSDRSERG